jgi:hypothetical protein
LEIYEVALLLKKLPDEIRQMSLKDVNWLRIVHKAQDLAFGFNPDDN